MYSIARKLCGFTISGPIFESDSVFQKRDRTRELHCFGSIKILEKIDVRSYSPTFTQVVGGNMALKKQCSFCHHVAGNVNELYCRGGWFIN